MIKVAIKFTENIWDNEANAEVPFELAYVGEALSVSAQENGLAVEQKVNGRTCGMFFKYKDLSSLAINDATVEDFMDLDNVEAAVAEAMAVKKLTIIGNNFEIYEDAAGTTPVKFFDDIDITNEFNKEAPLNWYIRPIKGYQIKTIESENAVVEIGKINTNGIYPFTIKGIEGNVLIQVNIAYADTNNLPSEGDSVIIGRRTYRTVTIGNQTWLAENLDFKFDGLEIIHSGEWVGKPYGIYYDHDEATYGVNGNQYGLLYNWYALELLNEHKDQLIPGWHIPSPAEWDELATTVGESVVGTKLKAKTGWYDWAKGTDDFGFTAFPAGQSSAGASFSNLYQYAWFWTFDESADKSSGGAYARFISPGPSLNPQSMSKNILLSVRLVKDA